MIDLLQFLNTCSGWRALFYVVTMLIGLYMCGLTVSTVATEISKMFKK